MGKVAATMVLFLLYGQRVSNGKTLSPRISVWLLPGQGDLHKPHYVRIIGDIHEKAAWLGLLLNDQTKV